MEEWRPVPGWEDLYLVSDQGRFRSLDHPNGRRGSILSGSINQKSGYRYVTLCRPGVEKKVTVHSLVMITFEGPCPPGLEVRHLNGTPLDCRRTNLEYGTRSENALDRTAHGTNPMVARTHCPQGHPLESPNLTNTVGKRGCLACSRARAKIHKNGLDRSRLQELSDEKFSQIWA